MINNLTKSSAKVCLSIMAAVSLITTLALPVSATPHIKHETEHHVNHHGTEHHKNAHHVTGHHTTNNAHNVTKHHATNNAHHVNEHHATKHNAHHVTAHHGHNIKAELEARAKAPHSHHTKLMYRVKASHLYERTGPGKHFHHVGKLKRGELVEIKELSQDGKWALAHTGTWLSTKYLEKDAHHAEMAKKHGKHHVTHKEHAQHGNVQHHG